MMMLPTTANRYPGKESIRESRETERITLRNMAIPDHLNNY